MDYKNHRHFTLNVIILLNIFSIASASDFDGVFSLGYFHYLDNVKINSALWRDNRIIDISKYGEDFNSNKQTNPDNGAILETKLKPKMDENSVKYINQTGIGYFSTDIFAKSFLFKELDFKLSGSAKYNLFQTFTTYGGDRKYNTRIRDCFLKLFRGRTIDLSLGRITEYESGNAIVDGISVKISLTDYFKLGLFGGLRPNALTLMPDTGSYTAGLGAHYVGERFNNHVSLIPEIYNTIPKTAKKFQTVQGTTKSTSFSKGPQLDRLYIVDQTGFMISSNFDLFIQALLDLQPFQLTDLFFNLNLLASEKLNFSLRALNYKSFFYKSSKILEIYPENEEEINVIGTSMKELNSSYTSLELLTEIKPQKSISLYFSPELRLRYFGKEYDYLKEKYLTTPLNQRLAYGGTLGFSDYKFLNKRINADAKITILQNFESFHIISDSAIGKYWTPDFFTSINFGFENDRRDKTNLVFPYGLTPYMETENVLGAGFLLDWFLTSRLNLVFQYNLRLSDEPINYGAYDLNPPYPDKKLFEHLFFVQVSYRIKEIGNIY